MNPWLQTLGRLHVVVVHFPIALLVVAAILELWRAVRRRPERSPATLVCLSLGAIGAVAAASSGWMHAAATAAGSSTTLTAHRWLGIAAAATSVLCVVLGMRSSATGSGRFTILLIGTAVLVGLTGHFGGTLTHGDGYLIEALTTSAPAPASSDSAFPADGRIDFVRHVQPILATRCYECHGETKRRGALRLDNKAVALKGGKSGAAVVPGNLEQSHLITRVLGKGPMRQMPLDRAPLTETQVRILQAWIEQGAAWPDSASNSGGVEETHWAYIKPARPALPAVADESWCRNEIDRFVLAPLERENLKPSPQADKATLLRRVCLDLIGLPPTIEQADQFLADPSPDAYERLVERLLQSPHFGEKWARPWLDLARYADSKGYEKDNLRTMWPWRDWVINALNADMPFDEFTVEQLAGDLLPNSTADQLVATGFHRNTMQNEEGGVDPVEARDLVVIERTGVTATVWLGQTLACAQCHDHKFDRFSQKEFYEFFAFFNASMDESRQIVGSDLIDISPRIKRAGHNVGEMQRQVAIARNVMGPLTVIMRAWQRVFDGISQSLRKQVDVLVMRDDPTPRKSFIHLRGSFLSPGEEVSPGVPAALGVPMQQGVAHNRLALARWLVSDDNPLTARVTVNRIWEQYFGRGIVPTSENFGTQGDPPSNPALLDWLATELVRQKWSLKAIHRAIVTSSTYRQSSRISPELLARDPENKLLARGARFRMEAEMIRDQALRAGGLLSTRMGGPSVFPHQPDGLWNTPYSSERWKESHGADRYRRGIYTFYRRSSPYPMFVTFDAPTRETTCPRRPRTDTALQALNLLNDPAFMQCACALARETMLHAGPSPFERATYAFRRTLVRMPDLDEAGALVALYNRQLAHFRNDPAAAQSVAAGGLSEPIPRELPADELAAWTVVCNAILNLDEAVNKE